MSETRKKVVLLGASLETGNMGVSALSVSLLKNVIDQLPDADVVYILSHRNSSERMIPVGGRMIKVRTVHYRMSPKSKLGHHLLCIRFLAFLYKCFPFNGIRKGIRKASPVIDTILSADIIGDIRGGDSFSDIYGIRRFISDGKMSYVSQKNLGREMILFPQTYGPYYSKKARRIAADTFKMAKVIVSRDKESVPVVQELLKEHGITKEVLVSPDVAFSMEPIKPAEYGIEPALSLETAKPVGINISGLLYHGGYTKKNMFGLNFDYEEFSKELVRRLLTLTPGPVLLVPHTYAHPGAVEDDKTACLNVRNSLTPEEQKRVHVVVSNNNQNEVKWIIGNCDFFIGARMHSCIAALSQGIPTIGVAYSKKFQGVFGSVGVEHLVAEARTLNGEEMLEKITACYKNREEERVLLRKNIAEAKKRLSDTFRKILL